MIYKRSATFLRSYTHIKQSLVNLRSKSASAESFESKFGNCALGHKELSCEIYLQRTQLSIVFAQCIKYAKSMQVVARRLRVRCLNFNDDTH